MDEKIGHHWNSLEIDFTISYPTTHDPGKYLSTNILAMWKGLGIAGSGKVLILNNSELKELYTVVDLCIFYLWICSIYVYFIYGYVRSMYILSIDMFDPCIFYLWIC